MPKKRSWILPATGSAVTALVLLGAAPATAAGSDYGQWTISGTSGTLTVPARGFPAASVSTNSNSPSVPSGNSAYLNGTTPFGAVYGSSQGKGYLSLRTAPGGAPSTTTITFGAPTTARSWAFALGDVDADTVQVTATGTGDTTLTAAELGWQGAFNYCDGSPRPSSCTRPPFTDVPTWNAGTSTLTGSGRDTDGAAGWFRPTVPVKSLTLTFSVLTGIPVYQVWVASVTHAIHGEITSTCTMPDSTTLKLLDSSGDPVLDSHGAPVTTTAGSDGSYTFDDIGPGHYQVEEVVPSGYVAEGPTKHHADTSRSDVHGVDFRLGCRPRTTPPTTPTTTPPTTPMTTPPTKAPKTPPATTPSAMSSGSPSPLAAQAAGSGRPQRPAMPKTGADGLGVLLALGGIAVLAGGAVVAATGWSARKRRG